MPAEKGQPAPYFSLTTEGGDTVSLEGLRGKPLVLYFYPKDVTPALIYSMPGLQS